MAVGSIILALIISPGDLGLYAIALIPATTFALFQDWGVKLRNHKVLWLNLEQKKKR